MNDSAHARQATAEAQEKLLDSKDRAVSAASDAAETVRDVAQEKIADARGAVESRLAQTRETIESKAEETREAAKQRAESGMSDAATGLKDTAHRLRDVSSELDEKDRWLGATLEQAASVADRTGEYLSGQSLNDVVGDAQRVARRNPAAFLGGAAALGFALSRLGKVAVDRADLSRPSGNRANGGVNRASTHASTDAHRMASGTSHVSGNGSMTGGTGGLDSAHAPTPAGMATGTVAPASGQPVTRPTDGRDLNPTQSTPMHRSQA